MDGTISVTRACDRPFEGVSQLFREDPNQAFGPSGPNPPGPIEVQVHPRWPWRTHIEPVTPRAGRLEAVGTGRARLNLTWQATGHGFFPTVDGHLEIDQMPADQCALRFVGDYITKGINGSLHGVAGGRKVVDEAIGQLLDSTVENIRRCLAPSSGG